MMIDEILNKAIDKALDEAGLEDADGSMKGVMRLLVKVTIGLVMAKAARGLTLAHAVIASDVVAEMMEVCQVPEEKQPEVSEELLDMTLRLWRRYASHDEEDDYDESQAWLCVCGCYVTTGMHCPDCYHEPPWGCDCSDCDDRRRERYGEDEDYSDVVIP